MPHPLPRDATSHHQQKTHTYPDVVTVDLELEDVAGASAAVGVLIVVRDTDALDRAPHAAHLRVHGVHLGN